MTPQRQGLSLIFIVVFSYYEKKNMGLLVKMTP